MCLWLIIAGSAYGGRCGGGPCLGWLVNSTPLSFRAAFVQLGFSDGGSDRALLHTCRHHTHAHSHRHTRTNPGPRSDITRHTSSCPTLSPHLGKSPGACPATTACHTHSWNESEVGGGTGCGAKRLWVATV